MTTQYQARLIRAGRRQRKQAIIKSVSQALPAVLAIIVWVGVVVASVNL